MLLSSCVSGASSTIGWGGVGWGVNDIRIFTSCILLHHAPRHHLFSLCQMLVIFSWQCGNAPFSFRERLRWFAPVDGYLMVQLIFSFGGRGSGAVCLVYILLLRFSGFKDVECSDGHLQQWFRVDPNFLDSLSQTWWPKCCPLRASMAAGFYT